MLVKSTVKNIQKSSVNKYLQLTVGGFSSAGHKEENQDAFAAKYPMPGELQAKGVVVALADGISSASHAAQAAQLSVTQFIAEYYATADTWSTNKSAAKVLKSLNQWLCSQSGLTQPFNHQASAQWLTTFTAAIFKSASGYVFHVGDTRLSKFSNSHLEAITRDHNHKYGNSTAILTRALGADPHLSVDCYQIDLQVGDLYMLTSDGVHDHLSKEAITALLAAIPKSPSQAQLEQVSSCVVQQALKAGSDDNASCVLMAVNGLPTRDINELERDLIARIIPPALKVGQSLDGYRVKSILHASVRSHLYVVECQATAKIRVLKAPSINFSDDAVFLQSFVREAWVGERVSHHNIMRVIKTPTESQFLYHVCEFVQGQCLTQWMHDNPKPTVSQVRDIVSQIISALRTFQRLELVHRDLKPDNIMIDQFGHITLIDYGTVAVAALDENINSLKEEAPQGTLNYIAPESLIAMQADHKSDLFSLGTLCYEMLSGELPYKPMHSFDKLPSHYNAWHYRSLKTSRPELPFWLDLALAKAVSADPADRYQAFSEFERDINKPDMSMLVQYQRQPYMQRNPVLFWQGVALFLLIAFFAALNH
jgi:protein phosphatase